MKYKNPEMEIVVFGQDVFTTTVSETVGEGANEGGTNVDLGQWGQQN